ncbi:MAG: PhzF family phenazine biosynthesis protein [Sphingobium sp.]
MVQDFQLVDVFGKRPFSGNPVAVVSGADNLDADEMLRITRWFNLSETTFLLPPTDAAADYRVRIFTLERELPFAGHPTLGTCRAWLEAGNHPKQSGRIVQQCEAGLIPIRAVDDWLAFAAPPLIRSGAPDDAKLAEVAGILGISPTAIIDAQWVDNGPGWIAVMLSSAEDVLALEPATYHSSRIDIGVVGPHAEGAEADFEIRAIFSNHLGALNEDPVTGSLNASVAQWLYRSGRVLGPYVAAQGTRLGREGRVFISRDADGTIWVEGNAVSLFRGEATV